MSLWVRQENQGYKSIAETQQQRLAIWSAAERGRGIFLICSGLGEGSSSSFGHMGKRWAAGRGKIASVEAT